MGLTISEARIVILLLFWVGGGWWVGEINIKDQLSPIEIETGTEFGKNKCYRNNTFCQENDLNES